MQSSLNPTKPVAVTRQPSWFEPVIWAVVAASVAFCYRPVFGVLVSQWLSNDTYSHGFLIPGVSLYIAWARRDRLRSARPWQPSATGFIAFAVGLAVLLAGRSVGVVALQELSLVLVLAALVLLLMGWRALRVLWLPIVYLLFMIPAWEFVTERMHYPFQLFSATVGAWLMGLCGVPVFRSANYLQLPNITLEVAKICSGVNYLLAVVAVGMPLAYLSLHDNRRRVLLVVFGTVIAILANPIRVALIGFLAYHGISENTHGPWHVLQGLFVAGVGYLALVVGAWWLSDSRRPGVSEGAIARQSGTADDLSKRNAGGYLLRPTLAALAAACLLVVGGLRPEEWVANEPTAAPISVPVELAEWKGRDVPPPAVLAATGLPWPGEVYRSYERDSAQVIQLYVGAFGHQRGAGTRMTYWTDDLDPNASRVTLTLPFGDGIDANRVELRRGGQQTDVVYWYSLNGWQVPGRATAKLYAVWARMTGSPRPLVIALVDGPHDARDSRAPSDATAAFGREALPVVRQVLRRPANGLLPPPGQ